MTQPSELEKAVERVRTLAGHYDKSASENEGMMAGLRSLHRETAADLRTILDALAVRGAGLPGREAIARAIYATLHHLMRVTGTEAQTAYETAATSIETTWEVDRPGLRGAWTFRTREVAEHFMRDRPDVAYTLTEVTRRLVEGEG